MVNSAPIPNMPLLRKTLAFIDEHPHAHDQTDWGYDFLAEEALRQVEAPVCGMPMCVSGWAQVLAGEEYVQGPLKGQELLGLTDAETDALFIETLTIPVSIANLPSDEEYNIAYPREVRANIQRVAERIAARAGERL